MVSALLLHLKELYLSPSGEMAMGSQTGLTGVIEATDHQSFERWH